MPWKILDTGKNHATFNMGTDDELLRALSSTRNPILHLYSWKGPSATYGHFTQPYTLLNRNAVEKHQISLAKRPTGGGFFFI